MQWRWRVRPIASSRNRGGLGNMQGALNTHNIAMIHSWSCTRACVVLGGWRICVIIGGYMHYNPPSQDCRRGNKYFHEVVRLPLILHVGCLPGVNPPPAPCLNQARNFPRVVVCFWWEHSTPCDLQAGCPASSRFSGDASAVVRVSFCTHGVVWWWWWWWWWCGRGGGELIHT